MQTYVVTCLKCDSQRTIQVHQMQVGNRIDWLEDRVTNPVIISGRERLDGQWGFQCLCGNNDLLTEQETKTFTNPSAPKPQELTQIVKNLKPDQPKFRMVAV